MEKSKKYYYRAMKYYENGYIDKALGFCNKSIAANIKNIPAIDLKGLLYYLKGDLVNAKTLWKLNARENNDSIAQKYMQGLDDDEERFKDYVKAVNLIKKVNINEALNLLLGCSESDYNSINVNNYLCICYMKKGEFKKSIDCLNKVKKIDKKNEEALENTKLLAQYGIIKNNKKYVKLVSAILLIAIFILSGIYILRYKKVINNKNSKKTNNVIINNKKNVDKIKSKSKESLNTKFPYEDFKNALDKKDFEKLYTYCNEFKNKEISTNDKEILVQGENELQAEGTQYFYKNATNYFSNNDYKNAIDQYLKAYSYSGSSYLTPHIVYFTAFSYENEKDYENALKYYEFYNANYKSKDYEETVLYKLAIIYKNVDASKAKQYASKLSKNYPNSIYNNSNIKTILNGNN